VTERPIKALVSLDDGIDEAAVRAALPQDPSIQIVGFLRGVEESWSALQDAATDLLVIACSGYSERALSLIGGAAREHPEVPIVVLSQSSPDGFLSRLFEAAIHARQPCPDDERDDARVVDDVGDDDFGRDDRAVHHRFEHATQHPAGGLATRD